ncbi:MAG TPA: hypothetical protein VE954_17985 [Oligoflexus sp.]|uniref:hypothetical protein n=1 Tax=Oligoflexus sp. TaxID=1971216 RepID=UPI002D5C426B|nr:hypothetical protein [Oligoflexus sp.]HYX34990.1 hypothetical protein [Oligoflexus sp.]
MKNILFLLLLLGAAFPAYSYTCDKGCAEQSYFESWCPTAKNPKRTCKKVNLFQEAACSAWQEGNCRGIWAPKGEHLDGRVYQIDSNAEIVVKEEYQKKAQVGGDDSSSTEIGIILDEGAIGEVFNKLSNRHGSFICQSGRWQDAREGRLEWAEISRSEFCRLSTQHMHTGPFHLWKRDVVRNLCEGSLGLSQHAGGYRQYRCIDVNAEFKAAEAEAVRLGREYRDAHKAVITEKQKVINGFLLGVEAEVKERQTELDWAARELERKKARLNSIDTWRYSYADAAREMRDHLQARLNTVDQKTATFLTKLRDRKAANTRLNADVVEMSGRFAAKLSSAQLNSLYQEIVDASDSYKENVCSAGSTPDEIHAARSSYESAQRTLDEWQDHLDRTHAMILRIMLPGDFDLAQFKTLNQSSLDDYKARLRARAYIHNPVDEKLSTPHACGRLSDLKALAEKLKVEGFYASVANSYKEIANALISQSLRIKKDRLEREAFWEAVASLKKLQTEYSGASLKGDLGKAVAINDGLERTISDRRSELAMLLRKHGIPFPEQRFDTEANPIAAKIRTLHGTNLTQLDKFYVRRLEGVELFYNRLSRQVQSPGLQKKFKDQVSDQIVVRTGREMAKLWDLEPKGLGQYLQMDLMLAEVERLLSDFEQTEIN